jgi:hypothetical protein
MGGPILSRRHYAHIETGDWEVTPEKPLDTEVGTVVCNVVMPGITIDKPSDVVKALVCATAIDHRTVKRWLREPSKAYRCTAVVLASAVAELGLEEAVKAIREAGKP